MLYYTPTFFTDIVRVDGMKNLNKTKNSNKAWNEIKTKQTKNLNNQLFLANNTLLEIRHSLNIKTSQ